MFRKCRVLFDHEFRRDWEVLKMLRGNNEVNMRENEFVYRFAFMCNWARVIEMPQAMNKWNFSHSSFPGDILQDVHEIRQNDCTWSVQGLPVFELRLNIAEEKVCNGSRLSSALYQSIFDTLMYLELGWIFGCLGRRLYLCQHANKNVCVGEIPEGVLLLLLLLNSLDVGDRCRCSIRLIYKPINTTWTCCNMVSYVNLPNQIHMTIDSNVPMDTYNFNTSPEFRLMQNNPFGNPPINTRYTAKPDSFCGTVCRTMRPTTYDLCICTGCAQSACMLCSEICK